jgi:ATP-dependent Lhr-like helicase
VSFDPDHPLPASLAGRPAPAAEDALVLAVRGQLEHTGPVTAEALAGAVGDVTVGAVSSALAAIEATGGVLRVPGDRWCAKRLAARIHARTRDRERRSFPPVSAQHLVRFLLEWQHVAPGSKVREIGGLAAVIDQLQGFEAPVGAWEEAILPARVAGYRANLLDELCAHGEVVWGRLAPRQAEPADAPARRGGATPSRATPVAIARREDLAFLIAAARGDGAPIAPSPGAADEVLEALQGRGALFFADLCQATGRMPTEVAEALWDGVARGWLTSDGFQAVRSLLAGRYRSTEARAGRLRRPLRPLPHAGGAGLAGAGALRRAIPPALAGGRWSVLEAASPDDFDPDELADAYARQLLARWGVVFRDLVSREPAALAWRDVLWALRRLEARGVVRGGRFVGGVTGEQFALPEALDALRRVASSPPQGVVVRLSAADPLNLTGGVLPGPRVPAVRGRDLVLVDGVPAADGEAGARPPLGPARRSGSFAS